MRLAALLALVVLAAPPPAAAAQDLLEIYQLALREAPQLISAQAASKAADARYRQARGQLLPQVSAGASFSKVKSESEFEGASLFPAAGGGSQDPEFRDQQALTLNLSQTLFDWSAWQTMDTAALRAAQAEHQLSATAAQLMVRTARSYFDVLAARAARMAAERQAEVIKKQLDRAKAAYESGLAPITDLQQARSTLDAVRVDAIAAANTLANSRDALLLLTGETPARLADASAPFKVSPPTASSADKWVALALANNPTLAAHKKALAAAQQQISKASGTRLPTLELVGSLGESERIVDFGAGNTRLITETTSIGLQLSLPLFAGGSIAAAVDEATANAMQTRQQLIATRRKIKVDTRTAFRNLQASAMRVHALTQAIESGRTAVAAAKAGMRNGTRNILDVLKAEIALIQRKVDRRKAWYDYIIAGLRLRQLTGQLSIGDLRRINGRLHYTATAPASQRG